MSIINNALSGSLAAQVALNATSQNTANIMTPGYTRQGVLLTALKPAHSGLSAGSGVEVSALTRFADSYKSQQMWRAATGLGQCNVAQPYLTQLEQVMGDTTSGINSGLDAFFSALNAASMDPTSSPLRQQVITTGEAMAQRFNSLNQVLSNQRASVQQQRTAAVGQVNTLTADVAALNKQISGALSAGVNASGLIDERDQKIDSLASLVGLQVVDQKDGSRSVSLRTGQPLVVGGIAATLGVVTKVDGSQSLTVNFAKESFKLPVTGLGGQLGGLDELERTVLVPTMQSITDMASKMSSAINTQLSAGFGTDGSPGKPLFIFDASSVTGMLRVDSSFSPQALGFSADAGLPGDSANLKQLIALQQAPMTLASLGTVSLGDAVTQLIGKLGMTSQQNQTSLKTAQTVRSQSEDSWASTSSVNQDEEAMNLVQYQQMYKSNMKVIAVANDLFDATLSMLG